eukprot:scaffold22667_cov31-Phaeocystis_antarctica.AAC.3
MQAARGGSGPGRARLPHLLPTSRHGRGQPRPPVTAGPGHSRVVPTALRQQPRAQERLDGRRQGVCRAAVRCEHDGRYSPHGYAYHGYAYHGYTYHGYTYCRRAMGTMGFSEELQLQMLGVISICLQLGNISFSGGEAGRHRGNEACTVVGGDWAQWSAHLLGVDEQKLAKALTYRTITETG